MGIGSGGYCIGQYSVESTLKLKVLVCIHLRLDEHGDERPDVVLQYRGFMAADVFFFSVNSIALNQTYYF